VDGSVVKVTACNVKKLTCFLSIAQVVSDHSAFKVDFSLFKKKSIPSEIVLHVIYTATQLLDLLEKVPSIVICTSVEGIPHPINENLCRLS
jgi:hypothetical protein